MPGLQIAGQFPCLVGQGLKSLSNTGFNGIAVLCVFRGVWPRVLGYAMEEGGWGATVLLQTPSSSPPQYFFSFWDFVTAQKELCINYW